MISKIISFCIVYLLSVLNFFVILSPLTFLFFTKYFLNIAERNDYLLSIFFLIVSFVSFLMLVFFIFNFIFNFSVNKYIKSYKNYTKYKDLSFLKDIFEDIKTKFNCFNVLLLIDETRNINAYAVGGMTKKVVILTNGLLIHYKDKSANKEEFCLHIKGILAHEMSHLINKDYFCGLFLYINEKALSIVSKFVFLIFNFLIRIISHIPIVGRGITFIITKIYKILDYLINFFYNKIVKKIYYFVQIVVSKNIEFRSDKQAGMIIGGGEMAKTLNLLGPSGWFNLFSNHPKTQNRVSKVKNIKVIKEGEKIKATFFVNFLFIFSFFLIIYVSVKSFKISNIGELNKNFQSIYEKSNNYMLNKKQQFIMFIENINNK